MGWLDQKPKAKNVKCPKCGSSDLIYYPTTIPDREKEFEDEYITIHFYDCQTCKEVVRPVIDTDNLCPSCGSIGTINITGIERSPNGYTHKKCDACGYSMSERNDKRKDSLTEFAEAANNLAESLKNKALRIKRIKDLTISDLQKLCAYCSKEGNGGCKKCAEILGIHYHYDKCPFIEHYFIDFCPAGWNVLDLEKEILLPEEVVKNG